MARKGNRTRRSTAQRRVKPKQPQQPTQIQKPAPAPPPSAPRQAVAARRPSIPPNSAKARAQRARGNWESALTPAQQRAKDIFGDVFTPAQEQREQRDEEVANQPNVVQMDPMEWWALEMARQGNDTFLFDYQPTPSINPPRPRTLAAGYHESTHTLRIRFRNGQVYGYYKVGPNVWRNFKMQKSPGRYINRVLNYYPYSPEPDLDQPTGIS